MGISMTSKKRSSFTGKLGFVLAAAGSAVGLGNIWRFPYLAAKYGGAIFLFVYIALAVTFGFVLLVAEIAIGRKTGLSTIGAFKKLDKRFSFIGWISAIVPLIILPYYSVIGGWVIKFFTGYVTGQAANMSTDTYFEGYYTSTVEPLVWFGLFIGITAVVVILGVEKGVEKVSKIMMPILIAVILFIAVYTIAAMPGAGNGVAYYLKPDFSKFSIITVVAAMGQLFYSMSLAMGIMVTYGSYMKKDICIEKAARHIEIFDTGIAFLAGLMIIPAVFAFSGGNEETLLKKGPTLMFVILPKVFNQMPGGAFIGALFFIMVFFAAVTSSISLMETVVSIVRDKTGMRRIPASLLVLGATFLLGAASALGYSAWSEFKILGLQILDFFDFISNNVIMPVVALLTCVFIGYFLKPEPIIEELNIGGEFKTKKLFVVMIKYVAPVFILAILVSSILDVFKIIVI